ncbi:MAG: large conductance mechanosensitive channel protein MscL [Turicibacter sp.]|nr:large conductance mechanosensitive channel protein MscL [Turicibacter sp.]
MKKFMTEFKDFALKGNIMSMAVGMIIGLAFQGVVSSLAEDIISPIIGLFTGQNFDYMVWDVLGTTLRYGAFLTAVIHFLILALVVFLMMKGMNRLMTAPPVEEETTKECPYCFSGVHLQATRCSSCTSVLTVDEVENISTEEVVCMETQEVRENTKQIALPI